MYPSSYGETVTSYSEQAAALLLRRGIIRQDAAHQELTSWDTQLSGARSGFRDIGAVIVNDYAGHAYYVTADVSAALTRYPHPEYPGSVYVKVIEAVPVICHG